MDVIFQVMAEEGWFWMLEKLRQTQQSAGYLVISILIAQGLPWMLGCHSDAESQAALEIASLL